MNSKNVDTDYLDNFDPDEHYKFLRDVDDLLEGIDITQCIECGRITVPRDLWECPDTGNNRCSDCQVDHEVNKCSSCRLAYEDE